MKLHTTMTWLAAAFLILTSSSCASIRYVSTLKPSGDKTLNMGDVRFSLVSLDGKDDSLAVRSRKLYPNLFTDEWTGLPVVIEDHCSQDSSMGRAAFLTGFFGLGIIPFPGTEKSSYSVETSLINAPGERVPAGKVDFEFKKVTWMTVLSPLGLLPVVGPSDLPRDYYNFSNLTENITKAYNKENDYRMDCHIEAVVKSLLTADRTKLADDYRLRKTRLQEVTIDGRRCWSYLTPTISKGQSRADSFTALMYQEYPTRGLKPFDEVTVARRDGTGDWRPVSGYLHSAGTLTAVGALMENGMPSRVVVRTVEDAPIEDFIDSPAVTGDGYAAALRWSNGVLLEAKNRSLQKMMREKTGSELMAIATRIEKSILDLSEQAERAKDSAQAKVEKGEGDPAPDREISVLCRQRIEILKPVLAAVKQAAAAEKQ
jgi:hypothetical protein